MPHFDLAGAALAEMIQQGFHPDFPAGTAEQVAAIRAAGQATESALQDLRHLAWSSIDNDTSRDLDQIEVAEPVNGSIRVRVGIANVSESVAKNTPIDHYAADQTQTVYTAVRNFPMLPFDLSTDLTSLNENQDRSAVVVEFEVAESGDVTKDAIYRALVRNQAQLAYRATGAWLEDKNGEDAERTAKITASSALQGQLKLQNQAAKRLHEARARLGALDFHRMEADPVVVDGVVQAIRRAERNPATDLIEDFMIAANGVMARTLARQNRSSIRRVVRTPERWPRIVELARQYGFDLPSQPDSGALNRFLQRQRANDPDRYPDLSLAVIKLMGAGEYVVAPGGDPEPPGHFALAAHDYTHSTAPNRRFADLIVQRLTIAMLSGKPAPYADDELSALAAHCTERESAARKVERAMQKRVAAVALEHKIGMTFRGVITGAGDKGVYVRIFDPPIEGKIVRGERGLDVGDKVAVKLLAADPERAYIDFGVAHGVDAVHRGNGSHGRPVNQLELGARHGSA